MISFFFYKKERCIFKKLPHEKNIRQNKEYRETNKQKERKKQQIKQKPTKT